MEKTLPKVSTLLQLAVPKRIVIATDLTDLERLVPHGVAQAQACGAQISLVHAIAIPDDVLLGKSRPGTQDKEELQARQILAEAATRIQSEGIECKIVVRHGLALEIVQEEIKATGATRLIIGTHRHGFTGQSLLGVVANALLVSARIPVFVIGPDSPLPPQHLLPTKILYPVSLTGSYRQDSQLAFELARSLGAELTLLHVLDSSILRGTYVGHIFADARARLVELVRDNHFVAAVRVLVSCGDFLQQIQSVCTASSIDWIFMGIKSQRPWWARSNNAAYQVIANVNRPVLAFHQQPIASRDSDERPQASTAPTSRLSREHVNLGV